MLKKIFLGLILSANLFANEDGAYLDPPYKNLVHPTDDTSMVKSLEKKNDVDYVISFQSLVRSQGSRGTCSIFSATSLLESLLVKKGEFSRISIDLSEEWLEYLVTRNRTTDGSNSWSNFNAIKKYGMPYETTLPYIGQTWKEGVYSPKKEERCGHLTGRVQKQCFIAHFDPALLFMSDEEILNVDAPTYFPEFVQARNEAAEFKADYIAFDPNTYGYNIYSQSEIKQNLNNGIPMTMGISFYYGAWNHRKANELGIHRSLYNWNAGIVGYPEADSMDRANSNQAPAGHSVVIVGYDDDLVVHTEYKTKTGELKTAKYKGVYFFKNSWGTASFGSKAMINGKLRPGYGMITQKYAHEMGSFYKMPLL